MGNRHKHIDLFIFIILVIKFIHKIICYRNIYFFRHLIRVDPKVNGTVGVETPRYSYDPEKKLMYQFPPEKTNGNKK